MRVTLLSLDARENVALFEAPIPSPPPAVMVWGERAFGLQLSAPNHVIYREARSLVLKDEWKVES